MPFTLKIWVKIAIFADRYKHTKNHEENIYYLRVIYKRRIIVCANNSSRKGQSYNRDK